MSLQRSLLGVLVALSLSTAAALGATSGASSSVTEVATADVQRLSGARQSARLLMHPQLAQPGRGVRRAAKAKSAMSAVFKPHKRGRKVVLQRKKGSRWVSMTSRKQNGRGIAEFTAPYRRKGKVQTYRARAVKYRSLGKVTSRGVKTNKWGAADFGDGFAGLVLGSSWSHRRQVYAPESQRRCSRGNPTAVKVADGAVRLSVINDPSRPTGPFDPNPQCTYEGENYAWRFNGHIGTELSESFKYGYAAARIKFQPRRGQHASFWMMPKSQTAQEGSARQTGAEIDVIEWFGKKHPSGGLTSFIHHYPDDGKAGVTAKKVGGFIKRPGRFGDKWSVKYHVFSVEWKRQRYIFRIDGKETFRTGKGVSGRPEFLILSLLSSDYELGFLGGDDKLPQHMFVDWVRYWEP